MIWIALMLALSAGAEAAHGRSGIATVLGAYALVCAAIAQAELNIARRAQ